MFSAVCQEQVIRQFLPSELIPDGWYCQERSLIENIRSLYTKCNKRIQMYGSPEGLEDSLIDFISFPGNQKFFQFNDSVFFETNPFVFHSLSGNSYIYMDDWHDFLLESIPKIDTLPPLEKLAHNLISYYLRSSKSKLTTSHEMILNEEKVRKSLFVEKRLLEKKMERGEWKKQKEGVPQAIDDVLKDLDNMLKESEISAVKRCGISEEMRKTITMVTKEVPVKENGSAYKDMLAWFYLTFKSFDILISGNASVMRSRSETVDSFPMSRIPIRLFKSGEDKVVMSHELLHAIKIEKLDVSTFEDKILEMPKLSAMSYREVFEMIPRDIFKMLEFIKIPLRKITKDLHIIPTIDGSYCLSARQFLLVTLCDVVLVKKVFQGMKKDQLPHVMKEFHDMLVDVLSHGTYFISYKKYEETKVFLGAWFNRNFPSPNQKEISNVNKNGVTCKDLKKQLERLELSEIFPNIEECAYKIFKIPSHGCPYKATKQTFQFIENIQVSYVFSFLSKQLIAIFHKRMWCVDFLQNCPYCFEKQTDEPSSKTVGDSNDSIESEAMKEDVNINEIIVTPSNTSNEDEASEPSSIEQSDDSKPESLSSSTPNETVVVDTQESVRKPKKPKKKMEKSDVKPEEKESQSCPKCIRASEYTKATNEKLRLSKIEVKHSKKQLSVVELTLEKKNERIRILEEKLREKENQLAFKSSEVDTLKTKNQELELKNTRNERLIATFSEVISKKDTAIKSLQCHNYEKDKVIEQMISENSKVMSSRSAEESEKVDSLLSNLLEKKKTLSKEDPLKKSNDICETLAARTNSKVSQQMVKYETKVFQLQVSSYIRIVENNIRLIRENQAIKVDQLSKIPDFPEFSKEFKTVHKSIMKKEAPLLCRQLLNLIDEIADMECVICITEMESHDGTTKCTNCKRRYHNHCITSWLKKNSICPACKEGMVDEQEFPAL